MRTMSSLKFIAVGSALALVAAACGDDPGSDPESNATSGGSVKIMSISPQDTDSVNYPEIQQGMEAAVEAINDSGGIDGRMIVAEWCNSRNDPNVINSCARKAVEEDVTAVVAHYGFVPSQMYSILAEANIPVIGPQANVHDDYFAENAYPLTSLTALGYLGTAYKAHEDGHNSISVILSDQPAFVVAKNIVQEGAASHGLPFGQEITLPLGSPDVAAQVAVALDSGSTALTSVVPASDLAKILIALNQSGQAEDIQFYANAISVDVILPDLGAAATNITAVSTFPPVGTPGSEDYQRDFEKYAPSDMPVTDVSINAWLSVYLFAEAAKGLDTIDGASIMESLNTNTFNISFLEGYSPSGEGPIEGAPRLHNTKVWFTEVVNGEKHLVSPDGVSPVVPGLKLEL